VKLEIENLEVSVADRPILRGVSLTVAGGEIHALMGPNGSGKSTLAAVLAGHPGYAVTGSTVRLDGCDLLAMAPEERARAGVFLAFQYPVALPGVSVARFLRAAVDARRGAGAVKSAAFLKELREAAAFLEMDPQVINRAVNDGFSGGEKKRLEILQMMLLKPRLALLDETDSGLDIDALQVVARGVNHLAGPDLGLLVVTHYERLLKHIVPQRLHILLEGRIVRSGGPELVRALEAKGYDWLREETRNEK